MCPTVAVGLVVAVSVIVMVVVTKWVMVAVIDPILRVCTAGTVTVTGMEVQALVTVDVIVVDEKEAATEVAKPAAADMAAETRAAATDNAEEHSVTVIVMGMMVAVAAAMESVWVDIVKLRRLMEQK